MFEAKKEILPEKQQEELRAWLRRPEYQTLRKVIEGKLRIAAVNLTNNALKSKKYAAKLDAADGDLRMAQDYAHVLDVLNEIADESKPLHIVRIV